MLLEKLKKESLQSRKEKNEIKSNLLSTILSQVKLIAIDDGHREPKDQDVIQVVKKFLKNIEENIQLGQQGKLTKEALEQALKEKEILLEYLPKQLSEEELKEIIRNSGAKNIGEAMKFLKENYSEQYDGKLASKIAKEILG
ncbi:MAG: GatB/YqeY domain-containing protein [Leptonema sp. (in: bacteria)]